MNGLIIYDSTYGNTEHVARAIAHVLEKRGTVKTIQAKEATPEDFREVDLLVMGCPTQGHSVSPAFRELLKNIPVEALRDTSALAFDTRFDMIKLITGSAAHVIAKKLKNMGCRILLPEESFFVTHSEGPLQDGELERAANWANMALQEIGETPYLAASVV